MRALLSGLARLAVPAVTIAAAFVFVLYAGALPPSLEGLKTYAPHIVFASGAALAVGFRRGRALFALLTLIVAHEAQQAWLRTGLGDPAAVAIYLALVVFVPLNLAVFALLPERGIANRHGALRLGLIAAEAALTAWLATHGAAAVAWAAQDFISPRPFSFGAIPQLGLFTITAATVAALVSAFLSGSAISAACAGAVIAFAIAAHVPTAWLTASIFIAAAELMIAIAVLQDTFRMAFRDELTGLPSRRALNERLLTLGRNYTVAMIDVDHFKQFNDTWGHEVGDQVLKMVAAHIDDVGGGGRAFRYGGEEFTVLFPGRKAREAIPYLEALRARIERYRLALRGPDRPPKSRGEKRKPGSWRDRPTVSVTVSIGVAERDARHATPSEVVQAADRALYRAKQNGRNRVNR